jgi:hypothetical protein
METARARFVAATEMSDLSHAELRGRHGISESRVTPLSAGTRKVFVSSLLNGHVVRLEQIADGVWSVHFGPVHLDWLAEADYGIRDVLDRAHRRR